MLKILKSIRNSFLILILLTSNTFAKVGKPSSKYDGAKQFWGDVKSILVDKKDIKSLKGYTK